MTEAEAVTEVRSRTDHDTDTQVTDAQIKGWLQTEHQNFRRELSALVPSLYTVIDSTQTIVSGVETLAIPSRFERLVRVEKLWGAEYLPVEISDELNIAIGDLAVREEGAALKVDPSVLTAGTYRIVYIQSPDTVLAGGLVVPGGCEDIVLERACAKVRVRMNEDPTAHIMAAAACWTAQRSALLRRYGKSPQTGLRQVRRW